MPVLTSGDLIISKYCMGYLSGTTLETCDHWDTYISEAGLNTIQANMTSALMYAGIIILLLTTVVGVIKSIFNVIFRK